MITDRSGLEARFISYKEKSVDAIRSIPFNPSFAEAVKTICQCVKMNRKLVIVGMGKAGHVGRKAASSFSSLGIGASFLHPGEAHHGDIGSVIAGDVLLCLSTSGRTSEVLNLVPIARNLGIDKVISITSHPDAPLRDLSDIVVDMGLITEADDHDLAPTTSIIVMLLLVDFLAISASSAMGFTREQFALRHHSGYLHSLATGVASRPASTAEMTKAVEDSKEDVSEAGSPEHIEQPDMVYPKDCAANGGPTVNRCGGSGCINDQMQACIVCGHSVVHDMVDHPFFGFESNCPHKKAIVAARKDLSDNQTQETPTK